MGGDHAPAEVVHGALLYARMAAEGTAPAADVLLVGDAERIDESLRALASQTGLSYPVRGIEVVPASQVIGMDEHPMEAVRDKRDSSLVRCVGLVREGKAQACFSAGNTGAMMVACIQILERVEGVKRPPIGTTLPTETGGYCVLVDAGANVDCKPSQLLQFALLGSVYARTVLGRENPRVGLLSNGEEESKGNELTRETMGLLRAAAAGPHLNFVGYVEGNHVFEGAVDVIVCDGFEGNILLKGAEGTARMILTSLAAQVKAEADEAARAVLKQALARLKKRADYADVGGAPLLGVNGVACIGHGRSDAAAVASGIRQSVVAAQSGFVEAVRDALRDTQQVSGSGL